MALNVIVFRERMTQSFMNISASATVYFDNESNGSVCDEHLRSNHVSVAVLLYHIDNG